MVTDRVDLGQSTQSMPLARLEENGGGLAANRTHPVNSAGYAKVDLPSPPAPTNSRRPQHLFMDDTHPHLTGFD